jgi:hypothetical protein
MMNTDGAPAPPKNVTTRQLGADVPRAPSPLRPARPLKLGGIKMLPCAHVQHLIQGRRRFVQPLCETVLFHDGGQR